MTKLKPAVNSMSTSLHEPVKILASEESLKEFKPKTIPEYFNQCCEKYSNLTALAFKKPNEENNAGSHAITPSETTYWTTITYDEYERHVELTALALLHLGVPERSTVAILAHNCPTWFYVQFGAIRINAVTTGVYTTNSPEIIYHILDMSDASVIVVDDSHQMSKIRSIKDRLPKLKAVVQLNAPFDFSKEHQIDGYYRWPDLMGIQFGPELKRELQHRENAMAPNDCALLIFTVGYDSMDPNKFFNKLLTFFSLVQQGYPKELCFLMMLYYTVPIWWENLHLH